MNGLKNLAVAVKGSQKKPDPIKEVTKKQSFYLPLSIHEALRKAAHDKHISQQEIFRQALDLWFAENGLPSWDDLKEIK